LGKSLTEVMFWLWGTRSKGGAGWVAYKRTTGQRKVSRTTKTVHSRQNPPARPQDTGKPPTKEKHNSSRLKRDEKRDSEENRLSGDKSIRRCVKKNFDSRLKEK